MTSVLSTRTVSVALNAHMTRDSIIVGLWFAVGWTVGNAGVTLVGLPWPFAVLLAFVFAIGAGHAIRRGIKA